MLKAICYVLVLGSLAASCNSSKRLTRIAPQKESREPESSNIRGSMQVENGSKRVYKDVRRSAGSKAEELSSRNPYLVYKGNVENSTSLQFKYSLLTDVPVEAMSNLDLVNFLEDWYGTPYRYGGSTKKGVDCSAFTSTMMSAVFGTALPRTVKEQFQGCRQLERYELKMGDLVFF